MSKPIRVLELRSVRGTGGGPEKTILLGAARSDPEHFAVTVCYLRDARDGVFAIDHTASGLKVEYVEVIERHSFDRAIWPALRQLVHSRSIEIVHSHDYKTNALAWLLAKAERVMPLSTVHGWTGHTRRERWAYYPLDKRLLSLFPRLIAVSEDIREELIRHGSKPGRVLTVLNGIDHRAFRRDRSRQADVRRAMGITDRERVIGSVGRLEPQKRFDILIDVFAEAYAQDPNLRLWIVGDGSLREALAAQVSRLRLDHVCRLTGHRTDIADLHLAFDLFVQSSDYEGTPNAVLEAMAFETPVIATDAGGTAQILRHGIDGVVVARGDRHALVAAIVQAFVNPRATLDRVAAARHRVETDLSFETRMSTVETVYSELLAGARRRPMASAVTGPA